MILAAVRDDAYNVVLLLHILAVIVAFAPATAHPLTAARLRRHEGEEGLRRLYAAAAQNGRQVYFPALIVSGVLGGALIGMSKTGDELAWKFDQVWISAGILVWLLLCGVVSGLILPAERRAAAGDASAAKLVDVGGQVVTLLVLVQLYLMIFKPGL